MKPGWAVAPALAIGLVVSTVPAATATTRYATPGGSASDPNCDAGHPCSIEQAINAVAQDGDEVVVAPGNYATPTTLLWSGKMLNVHGQDGQPRPNVIAPFAVVSMQTATGSTVRHMRLEGTSAQATLNVASSSSVTLSDLVVVNSVGASTTGTAVGIGVTTPATAMLRDSVALATGPNSRGLLVGGVGGDAVATAINVTAYATTPPNSSGIMIGASDGHPATLTAKNTVAHGTLSDISLFSSGSGTTPAIANVSYSNYRPSLLSLQGAAAALNDQGRNQSADPLFANPGAEDFHELAGSPTIDAGTTDPQLGGLDFDGESRVMGSAPDIGADELVPSSAPGSQPRAPKLSLKGSKRQRVLKQRGVVVRVSCDQACTTTGSASVAVPGASKTYKFRKASKTLAGGASAKLKLKLSKKALSAIRRALRRGKRLKARVTVTAVTSGVSSTAKLAIRLRR